MGYKKMCVCQHAQGRKFDDFGTELLEDCERCRNQSPPKPQKEADLGQASDSWVQAEKMGKLGKF